MRSSARLLIFILFSCFSFLGFYTPAFAQTYYNTPPPATSYTLPQTSADVPHDSHTLTQGLFYDVLSAVTCQIGGIDPLNPQYQYRCLTPDKTTGVLGFDSQNMGLIGTTTKSIGYFFQLPVSTHDYIAYAANKFGFTKIYAATTGTTGAVKNGVGFTSLSPLLPIWAAFRNIVYLLFVIIFILVGLAIMLRVQIDPRTVMTIQNQLPKIIIGLILVTFSFAIAGVLIDIMWVLVFVVINIMTSVNTHSAGTIGTMGANNLGQVATQNLFQNPIGYANEVLNNNAWGGLLGLAGAAGRGLQMIVANMFTTGATNGAKSGSDWLGIMPPQVGAAGQQSCGWADWGCFWSQTVLSGIGSILSNVVGWLISWVVGILGVLVILIALLIALFRVWFMLLRAYIFIILDVLLAPFYIVLGLIPGSTIGFGSWVKSMAANLLAFPTVVFIFTLARVLVDNFFSIDNKVAVPGGSLFVPPLVGNPNGTGQDNPIGGLIAVGLIFIAPEILTVLRKVMGTSETGLGGAAMAGFGGGMRFLSNGVRSVGGAGLDYFTGRNPVVPRGFGAVMRGFLGR